jgi:hypothetical protein
VIFYARSMARSSQSVQRYSTPYPWPEVLNQYSDILRQIRGQKFSVSTVIFYARSMARSSQSVQRYSTPDPWPEVLSQYSDILHHIRGQKFSVKRLGHGLDNWHSINGANNCLSLRLSMQICSWASLTCSSVR